MSHPSRSRFIIRQRLLEIAIVLWAVAYFTGFFDKKTPQTPSPLPAVTATSVQSTTPWSSPAKTANPTTSPTPAATVSPTASSAR